MKSVIDPSFAHLADEFRAIVDKGDYTPLKVFCDKRNRVELIATSDGRKYVLKRYRHLPAVTGLIYTLFRKTKARRAYEYAQLLLEKGIDTPRPVAYFERGSMGIFRDGWFISEYVDLPTLEHPFYYGILSKEERRKAALDLSWFTYNLHSQGIQPLDYNMSNIMYRKEGEDFKFTLIDINRMRIGHVPDMKESMRSFFQLGTFPDDYLAMLGPYTAMRGYDFETALYRMIRHRRRFFRLRAIKRFFSCKKAGN